MFCKHCGNQIADDAIFCSHCGTRLVDETPAAPQMTVAEQTAPAVETADVPGSVQDPEVPRKPFLEGMEWNVSEYPDSNVTVQTEDIDFDWGMDPDEVPEMRANQERPEEPVVVNKPKTPEAETVSQVFDRVVPAEEAKASIPVREALEAANKVEEVGQFNTFNRKNAEFQQLLEREYEKVRGAGTIGEEQVRADEAAAQKYDSEKESVTMDDFLQQEGVVKIYEPEPLQSDVLDRIAALEKQKAQKEAEEAARIKALEEARAEALARKRAEEAAMNAQIEARAAAEAEIREAENAEALRLKMEEERRKAAEDAARLEAIARRQAEEEAKAQEEMRLKAAEEARARAEAEAKARAEEEARIQAEAQAKAEAEEAARAKAEAELKAAREAARIKAQREAALAAREEAEFKAAQERKRREEEIARLKKEAEEKQRARSEESAVVEDEVRKALEQTARMRQEEEDKIKAALAGIRGGRFSDTLSATEKALPEEKPSIKDTIQSGTAPTAPAEPEGAIPEHVEAPTQAQAEETVPGGTIFAERDKIEEAHRHTRYNIEGMAKAREDFFADLPGGDPAAERRAEDAHGTVESSRDSFVSPMTKTVDKEAIAAGLTSTKKLSKEDFDLGAAMNMETAEAQKENDDLLSQFASVMEPAPVKEEIAPPVTEAPSVDETVTEIPAEPVQQLIPEEPVQELIPEEPVQQLIPEEPVQQLIPEEPVQQLIPEEPVQQLIPEEPVQELIPEEPVQQLIPEEPVQQLIPEEPVQELILEEPVPQPTVTPVMPAAEQVYDPALEALKAEKPGLEDTMIMPQINRIDEFSQSDFENYGEKEAEELKRLKEAAARQEAEAQERTAAAVAEIANSGVSTGEAYDILEQIEQDAQMVQQEAAQTEMVQGEPQLTAKELKKQERAKAKEAKRAAKEKKKEEKRQKKEDMISGDAADESAEAAIVEEGSEGTEKKGGKGRLILMIILILLCVIFALELIGIGIKMFASTSGAAEFIDSILNRLIQAITGN